MPNVQKIYHGNDLRPDLMKLSLASRRLFYLCLSKLKRNTNPKNVEIFFDPKDEIIITVEEYMECGVAFDESYRQMIVGAKDLVGYVCTVNADIFYSNPEKQIEYKKSRRPKKRSFTLASYAEYQYGSAKVLIRLSDEVGFFIAQLTNEFTSQMLKSALTIPESNAGKLYLLLREWISGGYKTQRIVTVDYLKDCLQVGNTYASYRNFNYAYFQKAAYILVTRTEFTKIKMEIAERDGRKAYKVKISYKFKEKEVV